MDTSTHGSSNGEITVSKVILDAQEILFEEGEPARCLYIVEEGTVEVFQRSGIRNVSLERLGPGQVVGELAVLNGATYTRGARALTPVALLRVSSDQIDTVLDESHALTRLLLQHVVKRLDHRSDLAFGQPSQLRQPTESSELAEIGQAFG